MVEDCRFLWNNGTGLRYQNIDGLTLRRNAFNYNSFRGEGGIVVRNVLKEDNEANFNNWRGWWSGYTGWAVAGSKSVHVRHQLVRDYRLIGNLAYGYWLDINCQNNNFQGIFAAYNHRGGFYYEICDGPAMLEHSILAYNGTGAISSAAIRSGFAITFSSATAADPHDPGARRRPTAPRREPLGRVDGHQDSSSEVRRTRPREDRGQPDRLAIERRAVGEREVPRGHR